MKHLSRWFRLYDDLLDDPKVQRLDPALFKTWVNLLCLASRNDGKLPNIDDMAFALRLDVATFHSFLNDLIAKGLIDEIHQTETYVPHNWDKRQYKSDRDTTANERQQRKRDKERSVTRDITQVSRPPDTDTDTDTDTEYSVVNTTLVNSDIDEALSEWNRLAQEQNLPQVQRMTDKRRKHLKARLRDCDGLDGWKSCLSKIRGSPFLLGQQSDWRCDFDFVVSESGFTKIMEGKYDARLATHQSKHPTPSDTIAEMRSRIAEERSRLDGISSGVG